MLRRRLSLVALLCLHAIASQAQVINETFSSSPASNFTTAGGTWTVTGGKYVLTSPVVGGTGNNNRSTHNTVLSGDWTLTAEATTTNTGSVWNDFSIIFGYQNADNYYYFSSNESDDNGTSGIMKVAGGTVIQLANITTPITANTPYTVRVEKTGAEYKVYRNNVQQAMATDATWSSGKVGFGTLSDGATFDSLVVTATAAPVATPALSQAPGTYDVSQSVIITSTTPGATIRYTLDGSTPSTTVGTLYTVPVVIHTTTTLKAIAYKSGMTNSTVTSGTYTIVWPAKPGPTNTGVPAGVTLTPYTGPLTITVDGTVIDQKDIVGQVKIQANNVTIRRSRITGGLYNINAMFDGPYFGLLIEDCELSGATTGIYGRNFTAKRLNIHDQTGDGIKPRGEVTVTNSWIHHLGKDSTSAHADGVQAREGGANMVFRHNNFDMPAGAALPPGYRSNSNFILEVIPLPGFVIDRNWLNGGNFTISIDAIPGVSITNNRFGRDTNYGILAGDGAPDLWSGNVWDDTGVEIP